jgi:hypothetical protein
LASISPEAGASLALIPLAKHPPVDGSDAKSIPVRRALACFSTARSLLAATDAEIDDLVYRLYGITDEERKIIEGSQA